MTPTPPDPAAPKMTWVHWVVYSIPPATTGIEAGAPAWPAGTYQSFNDWQREGYGGPCPPIGRHRYVHKLYALDTVLPPLRPATKASLERAMQGHTWPAANWSGTTKRSVKSQRIAPPDRNRPRRSRA